MSLTIVCNGCGAVLYEGRDMIPLYRLRRKTDGKSPQCGRKLSVTPITIDFDICGS